MEIHRGYVVDAEFYKEFGELKGQVAGMSKQLDSVETNIVKISDKIDKLGAVPYSVFDDHLKTAGKHVEHLTARADENKAAIDSILKRLDIDDSSLSGRLSIFFNNAAIKIIGGGVTTLVVVAVGLSYLNQINDMRRAIEALRSNDIQIKTELENKQ